MCSSVKYSDILMLSLASVLKGTHYEAVVYEKKSFITHTVLSTSYKHKKDKRLRL